MMYPEPRKRVRSPWITVLLGALGAACLAAGACGDSGGESSSTGTGGGSTGSSSSSSSGEGGGPVDPCAERAVGCFDDAACYTDPPTGVSFTSDVLPIFERSCSLSNACHGNPSSPTTSSGYRPYMGKSSGSDEPSDIDLIFEAMATDSFIDPGKTIVVPGDWRASTLMNKMDGALDDCSDLSCPDDCGLMMPQGQARPLPLAERNLIRAWIEEGAEQN
jgi:hypothetical protein